MNEIKNLENKRLTILSNLKMVLLFLSGLAVLAFTYLYFSSNDFLTSLFIPSFCVIFLYQTYRNFIVKNFNYEFKNKLLREIITNISPNLDYFPNKFIDKKEFYYPNIYKIADFYGGNDLIEGKFKGVNIKLSDLFLQEEIITYDEKGNQKVRYETIFKGIFFIADFNKFFTSKTYVLSNKIAFLNKFGNRAYMDDVEFEKCFKTFTNDQINARYVLTPNFMERVLKIKNYFKKELNFAFLDSKIYIYLEFNYDSFEPKLHNSLIGENSILEIYEKNILEILNLVEELNLNNKIWKNYGI